MSARPEVRFLRCEKARSEHQGLGPGPTNGFLLPDYRKTRPGAYEDSTSTCAAYADCGSLRNGMQTRWLVDDK
jgi:hypothetical protein